jgi:hypothetical protein
MCGQPVHLHRPQVRTMRGACACGLCPTPRLRCSPMNEQASCPHKGTLQYTLVISSALTMCPLKQPQRTQRSSIDPIRQRSLTVNGKTSPSEVNRCLQEPTVSGLQNCSVIICILPLSSQDITKLESKMRSLIYL